MGQYEITYITKLRIGADSDEEAIKKAKELARRTERVKRIRRLGKHPRIIYKEE